jgi:6-phosphogluconolactonase (cycloisomerase 2 family)
MPRGLFLQVGASAQGATRLALLTRTWLMMLDDVVAAAILTDAELSARCPGVVSSCELRGTMSQRTIDYDSCTEVTANGRQIRRDGRVVETVDSPSFCTSERVEPGQAVSITLDDFTLTETHVTETSVAVEAAIRVARLVRGTEGCAGPDVDETIDGSLHIACTAGAGSVRCPFDGGEITLDLASIARARRSEERGSCVDRHTLSDGRWQVSNTTTGERFTQSFDAFAISEQTVPGSDALAVEIAGGFTADCLGAVVLETAGPLVISAAGECPVGGPLLPRRPLGYGEPIAVRAPPARLDVAAAIARGSVPAPAPPPGFRQTLFRAANGQVYQVIQFSPDEGDNGAEAVRVTTVVGSQGDATAACVNTAGPSSIPTAVTAAPAGKAFPIESVFKSPLLPYAGAPCFNRNADGGNGRLCVGAGCSADCACPLAGACAIFALGSEPTARMPIGEPVGDIPAASLAVLDPPFPPCQGFAGREAYRFGDSGPTTSRGLCTAPPSDGFRLAGGGTVVFAYDTGPLELFNAGAAGLLVDENGQSAASCMNTDAVLSPGRIAVDTAFAPRVEFDADGSSRYYYDDPPVSSATPDARFAACTAGALLICDQLPPPTPNPERPCEAVTLEAASEVFSTGTTVGETDRSGGADCGWTGGGSGYGDRVYEYVAREAATYDVEILGEAGFEPYLYIRDRSCEGEQLACSEGSGTSGRASAVVNLTAGQRVAIIVDGQHQPGGFQLRVRQRLADLVVRAVNGTPNAAEAGASVTVQAEVSNRGNAAAGPFAVDFFLARDPAALRPISLAALRCPQATGLAPGATVICTAPNPLTLPLIAAGEYQLIAAVDPVQQVTERDESNNRNVIGISITSAPGATLEQRVFRAADGTVYQLIQVVPQLQRTVEASFRVTSIAASLGEVDACETDGVAAGDALLAAVGSAAPIELAAIRRTGIVRPNNFGAPDFDDGDGGVLTVGAGDGAVRICSRPERCVPNAATLVPIAEATGGVPGACVATAESSSYCPAGAAPTLVAFGVEQNAGICAVASAQQLGTESRLCNSATTVAGLPLQPGEIVVFVYAPGREAVNLGAGALAVGSGSGGPCGAGQLSSAEVRTEREGRVPLLEVVHRLEASSFLTHSAAAPDGRHFYVVGFGKLVALAPTSDGRLVQVDVQTEGVRGARGLAEPFNVTLSPDGRHIYVVGQRGTVSVYARDASTGLASFVELETIGEGGSDHKAYSVGVSPDGRHVYVASQQALIVYARDTASGALSFVEAERENTELGGVGPIGGDLVRVSGDGASVYLLRFLRSQVVTFTRDAATGTLEFVGFREQGEGRRGGLLDPSEVTATPDGRHIYVLSVGEGSITGFSRDSISGALQEIDRNALPDVVPVPGNSSLVVSPDGRHLYVLGVDLESGLGVVALLARNVDSGALTLLDAVPHGEDDFEDFGEVDSVAMTADGRHLYVAIRSAILVFSRDVGTGALELVARNEDAQLPAEFFVEVTVSASADGRHVYVARQAEGFLSFDEDRVLIYERDPSSGSLMLVGEVPFGFDGETLVTIDTLTLSADGRHLYLGAAVFDASGGGRHLRVYARNTMTGALDLVDDEAFGSENISVLASSPDDRMLYATSGFSDTLTAFARDPVSGMLTLTDVIGGELPVDGLGGARAIAVTGDHVYVSAVGDDALSVFEASGTGELEFVEVLRDEDGGLDGLLAPSSVAETSDGRHVYVGTQSGVAAFARRPDTGLLDFVGAELDATDSVGGSSSSVLISNDERQVYVAGFGDHDVAVFARDAVTAKLTFIQGTRIADNPTEVVSLSGSIDGRYVYVTGGREVAVFSRDLALGTLAFVDRHQVVPASDLDGLVPLNALTASRDGHVVIAAGEGAVAAFAVGPAREIFRTDLQVLETSQGPLFGAVVLSRDTKHIYVAGNGLSEGIGVLAYESATGRLHSVEVERAEESGVAPLGPDSVAVCEDGRHLYAAGALFSGTSAVLVFDRNPDTGALAFSELQRAGENGVEALPAGSPLSVTVSRDGRHVYVGGLASGEQLGGELVVFARDMESGKLTFAEALRGDGTGDNEPFGQIASLIVSADGQHVYTGGSEVLTFKRDGDTGRLTLLDVEREGQNGVRGLSFGATSLAMSADDQLVFVASGFFSFLEPAGGVLVFARDAATGALSFIELREELTNVVAVAAASEGTVFAANQGILAVLRPTQ